MGIIKNKIAIKNFDVCKLDNKTRKEITLLYPTRKNGAYYLDKFNNFLKDYHNLNIKDYCIKILEINWPQCPESKEDVGFRVTGQGIILSTYKVGKINKNNCEAFRKGCEKLSKDRLGKNNPMYGKIPWNKGKDKRDPRIRKIAKLRKGKKHPQK